MNDKAPTRRGRRPIRARRGISLVETLVAVSIVALLLGVLLPTLSSIKRDARLMVERSSMRQLIAGYIAYSGSQQGALMPGHKQNMKAWDEHGNPVDAVGATTYVWRLAPYLDHAVDVLFPNQSADVLERFRTASDFDTSTYQRMVGLYPSFGLNAIWLGGDQQNHAWDDKFLVYYGRYYARYMAQVQRPSEILVFSSSQAGNWPLPPPKNAGFHKLLSPRVTGPRWNEENRVPRDRGYVHPRHGGSAVTAMVDGAVRTMTLDELWDMRHWADQATGPEWELEPLNVPDPG